MPTAVNFLIFFALLATCSVGSSSRILPLPAQLLQSFKINETQPVVNFQHSSAAYGRARVIPVPAQPLPSFKINDAHLDQSFTIYTVIIRTSCSSVPTTRDSISLEFGDHNGNVVRTPNLNDPNSATFRQCSTDAFAIRGPPMVNKICYSALYRSGGDGWTPYDVTILGGTTGLSNFYFGVPLPGDFWWGVSACSNYETSAAAADDNKSAVKK